MLWQKVYKKTTHNIYSENCETNYSYPKANVNNVLWAAQALKLENDSFRNIYKIALKFKFNLNSWNKIGML